jgi:hypothetical protein
MRAIGDATGIEDPSKVYNWVLMVSMVMAVIVLGQS